MNNPLDFTHIKLILDKIINALEEKLTRKWDKDITEIEMHVLQGIYFLTNCHYTSALTLANLELGIEIKGKGIPIQYQSARSLLEMLFTVLYLSEDLNNRCKQYWVYGIQKNGEAAQGGSR